MSDFGGKPVTGEVVYYTTGNKKQEDPQVFMDALDALLDIEGVEAVRWEQYTPYFNDGEPCEFRIYECRINVIGMQNDDDDDDIDDDFIESWDFNYKNPGLDVENYSAISLALKSFSKVLSNGSHYVVLHTTFGDPAQVTATKKGFTVESYDHD